jgi:hypothetical protein
VAASPTITAIQSFWRWRDRSMSVASATQRGLKSMNSSRPTVRSARRIGVDHEDADSLMGFLPEAFQDRHDFLDVGQLADEVVGTGAQRVFAVLGVVEVAGDHDVRRVVLGLDQAGGLQAAHFRHGQIHQHHLRAQRLGAFDRFQAIAGAADDLEPVDLAEVAHGRVDETFVVVDQQDGELVHGQHPVIRHGREPAG